MGQASGRQIKGVQTTSANSYNWVLRKKALPLPVRGAHKPECLATEQRECQSKHQPNPKA